MAWRSKGSDSPQVHKIVDFGDAGRKPAPPPCTTAKFEKAWFFRSELVTSIPLRSTRQSVLLALRSTLKFSYPQLATVPFVSNLSLSSSNANCENFVSPRAFWVSYLLFVCITCILTSSTYGISSSILSELKNRRKGKNIHESSERRWQHQQEIAYSQWQMVTTISD